MFFPHDRVRVWLYAQPTDMRKQFDGLAALARNQLHEDPMSGHAFVFVNRRRTYMKVLYFDRGGYCLWSEMAGYLGSDIFPLRKRPECYR